MQNTLTDPRARLVVWHLSDSALPTGGFAHSAGMETYLQRGQIAGADSFAQWLQGFLYQAAFNDALAARFAVELYAAGLPERENVAKLRELDLLCHASQTPKELRASMQAMGRRMTKVGVIVSPDSFLVEEYARGVKAREYRGNPGLAAGLVLGSAGIDELTAVEAYMMQLANSMVQNAIRAIPLGQDAGQRVLVGAYDSIQRYAQITMDHTIADLGVAAPDMEIAQMEHETLHSRMFMS